MYVDYIESVRVTDSWKERLSSGLTGVSLPLPNAAFGSRQGWDAQCIMERLDLTEKVKRKRLARSPVADWFTPEPSCSIASSAFEAMIEILTLGNWVLPDYEWSS